MIYAEDELAMLNDFIFIEGETKHIIRADQITSMKSIFFNDKCTLLIIRLLNDEEVVTCVDPKKSSSPIIDNLIKRG